MCYWALNPLNNAYEASFSTNVVFDILPACCSQFLDLLGSMAQVKTIKIKLAVYRSLLYIYVVINVNPFVEGNMAEVL